MKEEFCFKWFIIIVILLVLAGCATTESSLRQSGLSPLIESELKTLHNNKRTISWRHEESGMTGFSQYHNDGTLRSRWLDKADTGTWWITKEGKFCTDITTEGPKGGKKCYNVYKTGDNEYKFFAEDGECYTFRYIK